MAEDHCLGLRRLDHRHDLLCPASRGCRAGNPKTQTETSYRLGKTPTGPGPIGSVVPGRAVLRGSLIAGAVGYEGEDDSYHGDPHQDPSDQLEVDPLNRFVYREGEDRPYREDEKRATEIHRRDAISGPDRNSGGSAGPSGKAAGL